MNNDYINPDAPVLGKQQFIKYQYQEPINTTPGYYYGGGGFDPFAQSYNQQMAMQPQSFETRRFMGPDISQMQQAQQPFFSQQPFDTMVLNRFVENRQPQVQPAPTMYQPPIYAGQQPSPWSQLMTPNMGVSNPYPPSYREDPYLTKPYGIYGDTTSGLVVPPINRREMWDTPQAPMSFNAPQINWNQPNQCQAQYCNTIPNQPTMYNSPFGNPNQEVAGSWYARAQQNWK